MLWLLGLGKWLKEAAGAACAWIGRNPALAIIIALCALLALSVWHYSSVQSDLNDARTTITQMKAAEAKSAAAYAARDKVVQDNYQEIAHESDKAHAAQLADARNATDAYIASHRVQGTVHTPSAIATSPASGDSPGVAQDVPTEFVMVAEADVRACGQLSTYAWDAYDFASKLPGAANVPVTSP